MSRSGAPGAARKGVQLRSAAHGTSPDWVGDPRSSMVLNSTAHDLRFQEWRETRICACRLSSRRSPVRQHGGAGEGRSAAAAAVPLPRPVARWLASRWQVRINALYFCSTRFCVKFIFIYRSLYSMHGIHVNHMLNDLIAWNLIKVKRLRICGTSCTCMCRLYGIYILYISVSVNRTAAMALLFMYRIRATGLSLAGSHCVWEAAPQTLVPFIALI